MEEEIKGNFIRSDNELFFILTCIYIVYAISAMIIISEPIKFEWDKGNIDKNWKKHNVSTTEAEEVFFDDNKKTFPDPSHSRNELRHILIGMTKTGRMLFVIFTIRRQFVRIISVRDLDQRERGLYEENT